MTTLEHELTLLRTALHAATSADLRRRGRRRRRAGQLAAIPALVLIGGGVAVAVDPPWGRPAPASVQQRFDHIATRLGSGTTGPLTEWARDGGLVLYGWTSSDGRECVGTGSPGPLGLTCLAPSEQREPGGFHLLSMGGATDRADNAVSGQVSTPGAVSVTIEAPGSPPTVVPVGHDGWFVAQLPDSTLGSTDPSSRAPELTLTARDAQGNVVARGS